MNNYFTVKKAMLIPADYFFFESWVFKSHKVASSSCPDPHVDVISHSHLIPLCLLILWHYLVQNPSMAPTDYWMKWWYFVMAFKNLFNETSILMSNLPPTNNPCSRNLLLKLPALGSFVERNAILTPRPPFSPYLSCFDSRF